MLQLSMLGPAADPVIASHRLRLYFAVSNAIGERLSALDVEPKIIHEAAEAVVERLIGSQSPKLSRREYFVRLAAGKPVCWLCGFPIPLDAEEDAPESFSIDHVIPKSKGGKALGRANLKPAHRFCNIQRGNGASKKRPPEKYEAFLVALSSRASRDKKSAPPTPNPKAPTKRGFSVPTASEDQR